MHCICIVIFIGGMRRKRRGDDKAATAAAQHNIIAITILPHTSCCRAAVDTQTLTSSEWADGGQ